MNLKKLLSWIPGWLGFLLLIIVGTLMLIHGAANPLGVALTHVNRVGFIVFGICALVVGAFSWIVGGVSKIEGREGYGVKVSVSDMPWWAWIVDLGTVVVSIALFFILS